MSDPESVFFQVEVQDGFASLLIGRAKLDKKDTIYSGDPLPALFLTEMVRELNEGAGFLEVLSSEETLLLESVGTQKRVKKGANLFRQGEYHDGIFLIKEGRVRTFCSSPSGRQLTLAYWTPGHFVGGPEIFGGTHLWSGDAIEDSYLLFLKGSVIRRLIVDVPVFASCLINALIAKGKCYSQLIHMLGTKTVQQRLAQLLLVLSEHHGIDKAEGIAIDRQITHQEIADIVGSTRQWVSATLHGWKKLGLLDINKSQIMIMKKNKLENLVNVEG